MIYNYSLNKVLGGAILLIQTEESRYEKIIKKINANPKAIFVKTKEKIYERTALGLIEKEETTFKQILDNYGTKH